MFRYEIYLVNNFNEYNPDQRVIKFYVKSKGNILFFDKAAFYLNNLVH